MRWDALFAVTSHEDSEIIDSDGLKRIKLAFEALTVAPAPLASEDGAIPHIDADKPVDRIAYHKLAVGHSDHLAVVGIGFFGGASAESRRRHNSCKKQCMNLFHDNNIR